MSPDDIKELRKQLACTAKELAAALGLEQPTVLAWERGELFPTKRYVDKMNALREAGRREMAMLYRFARVSYAQVASAWRSSASQTNTVFAWRRPSQGNTTYQAPIACFEAQPPRRGRRASASFSPARGTMGGARGRYAMRG